MIRIALYILFALIIVLYPCAGATADTGRMRIVSLTPHITQILFDVGAGESVVGAPFTYHNEHSDIADTGSFMNPSLEKIVSLDPTIIIGSSASARPELIAKLKKLGYRVELVDEISLSDIYDSILFIGQLTDKGISAKKVVDDMKGKMAQLESSILDKPVKTAFYQVWNRPLMTIGEGSYISEILIKAHLQPINSGLEGYGRISTEEVVKADPDIILIPYDGMMNVDKQALIRMWDKYPQIKAVKTHRVLIINSENLHLPGTRLIKGYKELIEVVWDTK